MSIFNPTKRLMTAEFVALMAALMSVTALSIDAMLPAFDSMERYFAGNTLPIHLVISFLFLGMAVGQLIFGPISDTIGRKPVVYIGMLMYLLAVIVGLNTTDFTVMLTCRFVQGFGLASVRTVTIAMSRDLYHGREMAQVTSFVMMVFILAPAIAPSIGQFILYYGTWKTIFLFLMIYAFGISFWLAVRQPETLSAENRQPFRWTPIREGFVEVCSNRIVLGNLMVAGFVMANLLVFLNIAEPVLSDIYGLGDKFPLYFGGLALVSAFSNLTNAGLVKRFGMRRLSLLAVCTWIFGAIVFLVLNLFFGGVPPLTVFLVYAGMGFAMIGFIFGNINALAMEPMGKHAGMAAAIIGSFSTVVGVICSVIISAFFVDNLYPVAFGYLVTLPAALFFLLWANPLDQTTE